MTLERELVSKEILTKKRIRMLLLQLAQYRNMNKLINTSPPRGKPNGPATLRVRSVLQFYLYIAFIRRDANT